MRRLVEHLAVIVNLMDLHRKTDSSTPARFFIAKRSLADQIHAEKALTIEDGRAALMLHFMPRMKKGLLNRGGTAAVSLLPVTKDVKSVSRKRIVPFDLSRSKLKRSFGNLD